MKHLLLLFTLIATCIMANNENEIQDQAQEYLRNAHEHKERNEIDAALHFYYRAIDVAPTDFNLVFEVANFLFSHGYIEQALTYYERAAELNPQDEQIYFNKGIAYKRLNQHEKAAECFLQAINTNHLYEHAHLHAVKSFRSCQKLDKGIQVAKRSIKVISNNAELHYRYGLLLKDKELYNKALKQFAKAVNINPAHEQYLLELGDTLCRLNEYQEALYVFERLLELNPTDTRILNKFNVTFAKVAQEKDYASQAMLSFGSHKSSYLSDTIE